MNKREGDVQQLLTSLRVGFAASKANKATTACLDLIFGCLVHEIGRPGPPGTRQPACDHLPEALQEARAASPEIAAVCDAFETVEPRLAWRRRSDGPSASANFANGHANATIVGPGGLEDRADIWIGVSLLAPGVRYPDHRHSPEEVYLALTRGVFCQDTGPWFEPGAGGAFYNRPGILHAMRSGRTPLLAIWCLHPDRAS